MTKDEIIEMVMQIGGCDRPEDDSPALKMFVIFAKLVAEKAIKEALAQEQEPVGQLLEDAFGRGQVMWFNKPKDESMLYTTPQSEKYPQIAINSEIVGYVAPQLKMKGTREMNNEPVAYVDPKELQDDFTSTTVTRNKFFVDDVPLYTHPVKDLEDIDINITWNENSMRDFGKDELNFARAILRKAQKKILSEGDN